MGSSVRLGIFLTLGVIGVAFSLSPLARADAPPQRDMVKEKAVWDQLHSISPAAVDLFKTATSDMDKEDYESAVAMFRKVLDKAPGFEAAERRLGISLVMSGKPEEGKPMLESLVSKHRSPENLGTLAEALAFPGKEKEATPNEKVRALGLVTEADSLTESKDEYYTVMVAQLALELGNNEQFRHATEALGKNHPALMQTHYFKAVEAAMDGRWTIAEQEIHQAEALGLPYEAVEKFLAAKEESPADTESTVWRYAYYSLYAVGFWVLGLILLFVVGKVLSMLTLRSIEVDDPNDFASNRHATIRRIYRVLINVAGVYYYISIPVVILLLLSVAGSITYGFFMLGHIPIKLVAIIVIGALVTAFKMIQSLFVRRDATDPGRAIRVEEAPGLWDLAREVSNVVGTETVDEIRLTPATELAVYENRSSRKERGKRVLLLGAGVLNGFSVNAFRAVLAHEYGHLSHRDTAGGEVALRVNANMMSFAVAIIQSGQAVWWNLGFWFVRVYHFIFRRLSHGATRLQEVLADRVAVLNYGAKAFEEGLRHVIRQAVEFEEAANSEIISAKQDRRALRNLYELESVASSAIEDKVLASTNRLTTEDDTHPSPLDRFRYAGRIVSKPVPEVGGTVWDLFIDRAALTNELSETINQRMRATRG